MAIEWPFHSCRLRSDLVNYGTYKTGCRACGSTIMANAPSYGCDRCGYYVHDYCARLKRVIQHPNHPDHEFVLSPQPLSFRKPVCEWCSRRWKRISYGCRSCKIYVCLECALESIDPTSAITFQHEGHQLVLRHHPTKSKWRSCAVCGEILELPLFKCKDRDCFYRIHVHCAPLTYPQTIQHKHLHTLTFRQRFVEDESGEYYCDACEQRRHPDTPVYSCAECYSATAPYTAHITCALPNEVLRSLATEYESSEKFETQPHQHHLIFTYGKRIPNEKSCIACKSSLKASAALICKECNFYQHYKCKELDTKITHPIHSEHLLSLHVDVTDVGPFFQCNACKEICFSFIYRCSSCNFNLCVRCIRSVQTTTVFRYRNHNLFLFNFEVRGYKCSYCGSDKTSHRFMCIDRGCMYNLHFLCAPFSSRNAIEHKDHEHTLHLKNNPRTEKCYICDGCPHEDDPLYCCETCNAIIAHSSCALLEYLPTLIAEFDNSREKKRTRFIEELQRFEIEEKELKAQQMEIKSQKEVKSKDIGTKKISISQLMELPTASSEQIETAKAHDG